MYCEECGHDVRGKFCSNCGALVASPATPGGAAALANDVLTLADVVDGWAQEVRYENILKFPAVRTLIEQHSQLAPRRLSGEQFLALADKLVPQPVSMEGLAAVTHLVLTQLGMKTNKQRDARIPLPVGEVLVRVLCSLARKGQKIRGVTQGADGCVIEATQPSDIWSLEGTFLITVRRCPDAPGATEISATATVTGQLYDWGKNQRTLDGLFTDLQTSPLTRAA
jgi:hypothetical protein